MFTLCACVVAVGRCLDAVRCVLPREAAMTLTVGWYGHCHGPGTDNGRREWDVFCRYLLGTMGYDEAAMFCLQKVGRFFKVF